MRTDAIQPTQPLPMHWRVARLAFDGLILGLSSPPLFLGGLYVAYEASRLVAATF